MSIDLSTLGQIKMRGSGVGSGQLTLTAPAILPADVTLQLGYKIVKTAVAAAATLTLGESGSIIPVSCGAADFALTLPAAAPGVNYKIIVATAGAKNITVTRNGADTFEGYLIGEATPVACAAKTSIVIAGAKALVGDSLDLDCYVAGKWSVRGTAQTAAAFA